MKRKYKVIINLILLLFTMFFSILFSGEFKNVMLETSDGLPIYRINTEEKVLSLSFDINWAEKEELYNILNILDKHNVEATFFIMGSWVNYSEENKEKLIRIKEGGHEIGNHSYKHSMFSKIDKVRMKEELDKTDKIIEEVIGIKPQLFRFPSGDYNKGAVDFINSQGYKCIQWDVDSVDWKELGAEIEYNRVMKKVTSGSIILFHNNARYTPDNLERIIKALKDEGYSFLKIGDMMYQENYYVDDKGEQIKK